MLACSMHLYNSNENLTRRSHMPSVNFILKADYRLYSDDNLQQTEFRREKY
jgi:hypothetical protein